MCKLEALTERRLNLYSYEETIIRAWRRPSSVATIESTTLLSATLHSCAVCKTDKHTGSLIELW